MKIDYELKDFSTQYKPFKSTLSVSWRELLWASITVGKKNQEELLKHGIYSTFDITSKIHFVYSIIKENSKQKLVKTNIYKDMDATEKGMASYQLGMITAKLFASKLFDVHWLNHLSNIESSISTWKDTKSRPDLVGFNTRREWVIIEAKGRSNSFDKDALRKAKDQTKTIKKINGQYPALKIATESFFKKELNVALKDPDEFNDNAINIEINTTKYLKTYYSGINSILNNKEIFSERYGVTIEVDDIVKKAFKEKEYSLIYDSMDNFRDWEFGDGIEIILDKKIWGNENMILSPEKRTF
jgi:hypothetical protein